MSPYIEQRSALYWESPAKDVIACDCGNTIMADGFSPTDEYGNPIEPNIGYGWDGEMWMCMACHESGRPRVGGAS